MAKYFSSTLQKGSKGDEVKEWQNFLNTNGYNLSVDGDFGDNTYNATLEWQRKNGLGADGIVGKQTWGKAGYADYSTISTPVSAPTVAPLPTNPNYDSTSYDDTEKGKATAGAYGAAKEALDAHGAFKPENFSQNQWLQGVLGDIKDYGQFSFDVNQDAFYQQAVDRYTQQGKLAMQDTMGQAAAMTGGYGNSYAQSAGQQAYQGQLDKLNDVALQSYQMALDRYNMGKQDLYDQYGLLMAEYEREYGLHSDEYNRLLQSLGIASDDYYKGADMHYTDQANKNSILGQTFSDEMSIWDANNTNAWQQAQWDEAARQYANEERWRQKQWDEDQRRYEDSKSASGSVGSNGGNKDNGGGGGNTTLWYATGTTDSQGNPVFRNSDGKTQAYGAGINPYTGTKHKDAKRGTFSNGYQPDNIGGTKLKKAKKNGVVLTTNITGKDQTIWEANGKYWLWRGDLNKYIEVDISEI